MELLDAIEVWRRWCSLLWRPSALGPSQSRSDPQLLTVLGCLLRRAWTNSRRLTVQVLILTRLSFSGSLVYKTERVNGVFSHTNSCSAYSSVAAWYCLLSFPCFRFLSPKTSNKRRRWNATAIMCFSQVVSQSSLYLKSFSESNCDIWFCLQCLFPLVWRATCSELFLNVSYPVIFSPRSGQEQSWIWQLASLSSGGGAKAYPSFDQAALKITCGTYCI